MRRHLAPFYSSTGRPSVDPELMIRMLIVGYALGIRSERRLCEEVHLNLAYRDKLVVRFGPRAEFGSGSYASTSLGVTPSQAAAGSLSALVEGGVLFQRPMGHRRKRRMAAIAERRRGFAGHEGWQRRPIQGDRDPDTKREPRLLSWLP